MFQRARVISLPRRSDRREILDLSALSVPWEFRDGVEVAPQPMPGPWVGREGHLGCLRAHQAVLAEIVADGVPTLILEDDAVLHPLFPAYWAMVCQDLEFLPRVDLLYLGGERNGQRKPESRLVSVAPSTWRTHAYAVTPWAAERILTAITHDPLSRTIDGILSSMTYRAMLRSYACAPWLVSVFTSSSDTGAPACPTEPWTGLVAAPSRSA